MRRNIKRIALLAIFAGAFMSSCTEDEFLTEEEVGTHHSYLKTENVPTSTESFALDFAKYIQANPNALTTLNEAIHKVVGYDLDENLTFYDILQFNNSVFFGSEDSDIINLGRGISAERLKDLGYNSTNYYGGLNIYWGYHDEWDGKTLPIIGFVEDGKETIKIKGYQITEKSIEKTNITIADFDSVKFPVIIINYSDRDYAEYPEFKRGIRQKGGKIWLYDGCNNEDGDENKTTNVWNDSTKVYKLKLTSFKAVKNYDIIGGSEFAFESAFVNQATEAADKTRYTCEYTRRQIKNKVTKTFNVAINPDWQAKYENMHFYIIEEDGGWNDNINVSLSVQGIGSLSTTLPAHSFDDILFSASWIRYSFITDMDTTNNTNTMMFDSGNTLKTKMEISDRPY
ncbi:MAG: hypothetical protein J6Q96_03515 [Bacteroidales bacterium]|nr:hypothetical protein [Bacteroidales bacterium]